MRIYPGRRFLGATSGRSLSLVLRMLFTVFWRVRKEISALPSISCIICKRIILAKTASSLTLTQALALHSALFTSLDPLADCAPRSKLTLGDGEVLLSLELVSIAVLE